MKLQIVPLLALLGHSVSGFTANSQSRSSIIGSKRAFSAGAISALDPKIQLSGDHRPVETSNKSNSFVSTILAPATLGLLTSLPAEAATGAVPDALVAYGHYVFISICMGLLTFERVTVKAGMSPEDEKRVVIADAAYGISAALLFVTGYYRAVEYGKGWDYYSHEPLFWAKISFAAILGGLSLFPTITFIKRGEKLFKDQPIEPMSEKLAKRTQSVINAEISALLSIPLLATLMARGVWYSNDFPWQAGAAVCAVALLGSGTLYAKQALQWKEDSE